MNTIEDQVSLPSSHISMPHVQQFFCGPSTINFTSLACGPPASVTPWRLHCMALHPVFFEQQRLHCMALHPVFFELDSERHASGLLATRAADAA